MEKLYSFFLSHLEKQKDCLESLDEEYHPKGSVYLCCKKWFDNFKSMIEISSGEKLSLSPMNGDAIEPSVDENLFCIQSNEVVQNYLISSEKTIEDFYFLNHHIEQYLKNYLSVKGTRIIRNINQDLKGNRFIELQSQKINIIIFKKKNFKVIKPNINSYEIKKYTMIYQSRQLNQDKFQNIFEDITKLKISSPKSKFKLIQIFVGPYFKLDSEQIYENSQIYQKIYDNIKNQIDNYKKNINDSLQEPLFFTQEFAFKRIQKLYPKEITNLPTFEDLQLQDKTIFIEYRHEKNYFIFQENENDTFYNKEIKKEIQDLQPLTLIQKEQKEFNRYSFDLNGPKQLNQGKMLKTTHIQIPKEKIQDYDFENKDKDKIQSPLTRLKRMSYNEDFYDKMLDFNKKYGQRGKMGIANEGQTCYINCVIQVLLNTKIIREFFLEQEYLKHIKQNKNQLIQALAYTIRFLYYSNERQTRIQGFLKIFYSIFKNVKNSIQFPQRQQHDSQEFFISLLDQITLESLEKSEKKQECQNNPEEKCWSEFIKEGQSFFHDNLFGIQTCSITCKKCQKSTNQPSIFNFINLSLPNSYKYIQFHEIDFENDQKFIIHKIWLENFKQDYINLQELEYIITQIYPNANKDDLILLKCQEGLIDILMSDPRFFFRDLEDIQLGFSFHRDSIQEKSIMINYKLKKKNIPHFYQIPQNTTIEELFTLLSSKFQLPATQFNIKSYYHDQSEIFCGICGSTEECFCCYDSKRQEVIDDKNIYEVQFQFSNESKNIKTISYRYKNQNLTKQENNLDLNYHLLDLIKENQEEEIMNDRFCENCKENTDCSLQPSFYYLPNILILVLQRVSFSQKKNNIKVQFDLSLDLSNFIKNKEQNCQYDLYGIVNHKGTNHNSGHYTSVCKNEYTDEDSGESISQWREYDDTCVSILNETKIVTNQAYMLFYQRKIK